MVRKLAMPGLSLVAAVGILLAAGTGQARPPGLGGRIESELQAPPAQGDLRWDYYYDPGYNGGYYYGDYYDSPRQYEYPRSDPRYWWEQYDPNSYYEPGYYWDGE